MNNATTEQPLPNQPNYGSISIHNLLKNRFHGKLLEPVVEDIIRRADKAQEKYKLEKMGLYAFNGRDSLLDAYQEYCDLIIYMLQFDYEESVKYLRDEIDEPRIAVDYVFRLITEAGKIRNILVEQGDFE